MAFDRKAFSRSNGSFLTGMVVVEGLIRRVHNTLVRRALPGRPRIRIHPTAFMRGLCHVHLGENFTAGRHLWLEAVEEQNGLRYQPEIRIGANVIVNDDVHIAAINRVSIGDDSLIASRVFISDHLHGRYGAAGDASSPLVAPRLREVTGAGPVAIGRNVWIGEMVAILPGVTIGDGCVIGAESVVTRDIPPASIAVGAPARVIKTFDFEKEAWIAV
jgi:lipopolysaccharide O-acetyltransferase